MEPVAVSAIRFPGQTVRIAGGAAEQTAEVSHQSQPTVFTQAKAIQQWRQGGGDCPSLAVTDLTPRPVQQFEILLLAHR